MERSEYLESRATRNMHALPRFGYPNEFALVFGTEEQRSEYIYGLLFAGVFILTFFIVWSILLLVFKCLGQNKVGMLSGSPMRVSNQSKKPMIVRIIFIISAITVVSFASVLVAKGLTQVRNGVNQVYTSSVEFNDILTSVNNFVVALDNVGQDAGPLRDELVSQVSNESFCPGVDLNAATGIDFESLTADAVNTLESVGNFTDMTEIRQGVADAIETTDNVQETSENITPSDWQSLIFIVPFSVFAVVYVVGVALAWCGKSVGWYICMLKWIVLPLFILLVVVCFLCAGSIAIAASANADFCSGGESNTPEGTIESILKVNGYTEEDIVYQAVEFYINQCQEQNPLGYLEEYEDELNQAEGAVDEFEQGLMNVTAEDLEAICGGGNFTTLVKLVDVMVERLGDLVNATDGLLTSLSCANLLPLYTATFWNGTCKYSVQGVTWTFASFLVIAVFGLLMITLRSAYLPTQDVYYAEKLENASMDYNEEYEMEYNPSEALSLEDGTGTEEDYGLEQANDYGAANVATGVAVGAAAGVAVAGAVSSLSMHEENQSQQMSGSVQGSASQEQVSSQQSHRSSFDDANWLEASDASTQPAGAQY